MVPKSPLPIASLLAFGFMLFFFEASALPAVETAVPATVINPANKLTPTPSTSLSTERFLDFVVQNFFNNSAPPPKLNTFVNPLSPNTPKTSDEPATPPQNHTSLTIQSFVDAPKASTDASTAVSIDNNVPFGGGSERERIDGFPWFFEKRIQKLEQEQGLKFPTTCYLRFVVLFITALYYAAVVSEYAFRVAYLLAGAFSVLVVITLLSPIGVDTDSIVTYGLAIGNKLLEAGEPANSPFHWYSFFAYFLYTILKCFMESPLAKTSSMGMQTLI